MPEFHNNNDELSVADQESIERLEHLNLGPEQKAGLILVKLGLKPAAELDVYDWNESPADCERMIAEAGLTMERKDIEHTKNKKLKARYAVAKEPGVATQLANIDSARDHETYGRLMGFPETAIHAFQNAEELLKPENYPEDEDIIFRFKLSKDHWPDEVQVMKQWSEAIKRHAPDLFEQLKGKAQPH